MKKQIIRIISCLIAALLMLTLGTVSADGETDTVLPEYFGVTEETEDIYVLEYEKVASNKYCTLYADLSSGHFALKNNKTGDIWYSTPNNVLEDEYTKGSERWSVYSQLVVEYLYKEDVISATAVSSTNSQEGCVESGSIKVEKIDGGIRVEYYFGDIGVTIPAEYVLNDNGLLAKIDLENIDEGDQSYITAINLLPYFGAGYQGTEGKILIPDGCGALVDFSPDASRIVYRSKVYGEDMVTVKEIDSKKTEAIRLPVFATLMPNRALMGVIVKGDGSASIRATNSSSNSGYTSVSSVCELRSLESMTMFKKVSGNSRSISELTAFPEGADTYEVSYTLLSGDDADYVGVAKEYRQYLIDQKGLTATKTKPSLSLDIYGAIDVKAAFLGIQYNKLINLTTFSEAEKILSALYDGGVNSVSVRYLGWSNYGVLNKNLPQKAKALAKLGGTKDLNSLLSFAEENESTVYTDVDLLRYRKGNKSSAITNIFNETAEHTERLRSVYAAKLGIDPVRLLSLQYLVERADKYLTSLDKYGIESVSLSSLGSLCYSNSSKKNGMHRYFVPDTISSVLESYKKAGKQIALEDANAYAAVYADRIYGAPTLCSGNEIFDSEIPFYQIVFHGYVATTVDSTYASQDAKVNMLKAVESGSELLYGAMYNDSSVVTNTRYDYMYSTNYELWLQTELDTVIKYQSLLEKIHDKAIIDHKELKKDIVMTTFEDGTRVIVNYNNTAKTVEGIKVDAMSYKQLGEGDK